MIIDCHANVGRPEHQPPEFLEEMLQPFFRASGKKLPASVYEGTEPEAMMEEYRRAGVDKVFIYGVSPRESQVFWARPRHASRGRRTYRPTTSMSTPASGRFSSCRR